MGRGVLNQCLLDITQPLHVWSHSRGDYLVKTGPFNLPSQMGGEVCEDLPSLSSYWKLPCGGQAIFYGCVGKDTATNSVFLDQKEKMDNTQKSTQFGSLETTVLHSNLLGTASVTCSLLAAVHLSHLCSHRVWVSVQPTLALPCLQKVLGVLSRLQIHWNLLPTHPENNDNTKSRVMRRGLQNSIHLGDGSWV